MTEPLSPVQPSALRRRVFALTTVAVTVLAGLGAGELVLRVHPRALGFERLAYLPPALKLALGDRFVEAYRATAPAYFAERATQPALHRTVPDARYGLRLGRPGESQPGTPAWPVDIDRAGFRNPALPEHADILVVGDSFVAGVSGNTMLPADVLFATRAPEMLGRPGYQAACYGWGPRQFHRAVAELAPRLRPLWVVIATYLENDLGDVWVFDGWQASPFETYAEFRMYRGLALRQNVRDTGPDRRSVLANVLRFAMERNTPQPVPLPHHPPADADRYRALPLIPMREVPTWSGAAPPGLRLVAETPGRSLQVAMGDVPDAPEFLVKWRTEDTRTSARKFMHTPWWPPYAEAMEATVEAARGAGAQPLIVLIPTVERVLAPAVVAANWPTDWPLRADRVPDGPARAVASLAAALGAEFVDLAPAFRAGLANGRLGYRAGDIHFNAAGHALAATAIAAHIRATAAGGMPD